MKREEPQLISLEDSFHLGSWIKNPNLASPSSPGYFHGRTSDLFRAVIRGVREQMVGGEIEELTHDAKGQISARSACRRSSPQPHSTLGNPKSERESEECIKWGSTSNLNFKYQHHGFTNDLRGAQQLKL